MHQRQYFIYQVYEKYLNDNRVNAEVINTGISGFSTAEELVYLKNEGIK